MKPIANGRSVRSRTRSACERTQSGPCVDTSERTEAAGRGDRRGKCPAAVHGHRCRHHRVLEANIAAKRVRITARCYARRELNRFKRSRALRSVPDGRAFPRIRRRRSPRRWPCRSSVRRRCDAPARRAGERECVILAASGGSGIRTHGDSRLNGFQEGTARRVVHAVAFWPVSGPLHPTVSRRSARYDGD